MATRFLLSCSCGREIPVDAGQAGDTARCECGNTVQVPKLGQLRLLPRVEAAERPSAWTARHGLLTLGGLVALACVIWGIYAWAVTPSDAGFDPAAQEQRVEVFFDALTPAETWLYWHQETAAIARQGLKEEPITESAALEVEIERGKTRQKLAFGLAGLAILFCIAVALWKPARRPT